MSTLHALPSRRVQVGRWLSALLALLLLAFSPTVAFYANQWRSGDAPRRAVLPPARAGQLSSTAVQAYAPTVAGFQQALNDVRVGERRRLTLSQSHYRTYLQARQVLGPAQASALMRLLETEIHNQNPALGRRSVFGSPEAAITGAQEWLAFLQWALTTRPGDRLLAARAPVPLAPQVVRAHRDDVRFAAQALHLAPGPLAAILDNEQAGTQSGLGLSGWLRTFTDTVALRATEAYGSSGATGRLSQTVGLTQMSWQDAIRQADRLALLGVALNGPMPRTEAEARLALGHPHDHLLLSASRLRGYLLAALVGKEGQDRPPLDPWIQAQLTDAWTYFVGPAWHNNPALASSGQTWSYAWNAFFKGCLYQRRLFEPPT